MISKIELKSFRVFESVAFDTANHLVIFSGRNATGKTTILEALYLCSTSKSHRTNDLTELIHHGSDFAIAEITADKKYKYVQSKDGHTAFINKSEVRKMSEFIGLLPVVLYSPDDISLVRGTKADKRKFLDMEISLQDRKYMSCLSEYKHLLSERNTLLKKDKPDVKLLSVLTSSLAEKTGILYEKRIAFLERINALLCDITNHLHTEAIHLVYKSTFDPQNILQSFSKHEKNDLFMKSTTIGIHRDEFLIEMNGYDASSFASEGQARLICIAVKLALKEYIKEATGREPVLLLDDVFAALDKNRMASLVEYVKTSEQTFITATSVLEIPDELLKNALVIRI